MRHLLKKQAKRGVSFFILGSALSASVAVTSRADVHLPALFSDHAVLQRGKDVPIWGRARPGEAITVELSDLHAKTVAGADGKWKVVLDLENKGDGPYQLSVTGENKVVLSDIIIGDVWLASGQSNMELPLRETTGAKDEIAASANPRLRHFLVPRNSSSTPADDVQGKWVVAGPETAGGFTAVGYYFAKALQREVGGSVGLIHSSWGGTPIENWLRADAMDALPEFKANKDSYLERTRIYPAQREAFVVGGKAWAKERGREDHFVPENISLFAGPELDISDWKEVQSPGKLVEAGADLPDAGAVWLRQTLDISDAEAGKALILNLHIIKGFDALYWNGAKVAETNWESPAIDTHRNYRIPGNLVKAGKTVIALRLFNPAGDMGFALAKAGRGRVSNNWLAKVEFALPTLGDVEKGTFPPAPPNPPFNKPGFLYNGMIAPLVPYAIRGVIWYQGEGNVDRAEQYQKAFPLLIQDWRLQWGRGELPFYFCQLANFGPRDAQPSDRPWAELRASQTKTLEVPNTGQAILIDIGEEADIHPRNKKDVGERLALNALAHTYGKAGVEWSGPIVRSVSIEDGKIRVRFDHATSGLVARALSATYQPSSTRPDIKPLVRQALGGDLEGFAICGSDGKWVWAQAQIEEDSVLVWAEGVPSPTAVRYAWGMNPLCNLYNGVGLPAGPFRTDDFPLVTRSHRY